MEVTRCANCGGLINGLATDMPDFWCECSYADDVNLLIPLLINHGYLVIKRTAPTPIKLSDSIRGHIGTVNLDPPLWEWYQQALKLENKLKSINYE